MLDLLLIVGPKKAPTCDIGIVRYLILEELSLIWVVLVWDSLACEHLRRRRGVIKIVLEISVKGNEEVGSK